MKVYDSNGPDVRIRGTAHQVCEKYQILAKDAASSGNVVLEESYLQHAEHYQRVINEFAAEQGAQAPRDNAQREGGNNRDAQADRAASQKDDLALPTSILGESSKAKDETRTPAAKKAAEAVD
ncbi:MAG: hypothetical protein DHS20C02_03860 [Micavibrio sp.]|nr:MAG: hypothetical protein DHS20C02_03860 [Micavibrio sp.]